MYYKTYLPLEAHSRQMDRQISDQFLKIASKVLIAPGISDF